MYWCYDFDIIIRYDIDTRLEEKDEVYFIELTHFSIMNNKPFVCLVGSDYQITIIQFPNGGMGTPWGMCWAINGYVKKN